MNESSFGEWLLLAAIIAMPIYSLWESDKTKLAVINGQKSKLRMYQETILFLWLPTLVLIGLLFTAAVTPEKIGLIWQYSLNNWLGLALVVTALIYLVYSVNSLHNDIEKLNAAKQAYQQHLWMMPDNKQELSWFALGVSVSAGICEELLFRGFLIMFLSDSIGTITALLLSSVMFGICHLYQGWSNVFRTALVGLIFGAIYLATDSLWVVIALHAIVDVYGGLVGYKISQTSSPSNTAVKTT